MSILNTVSILNQRLAKQLWVSIALASLLPIFVTIYLVSSLLDRSKPSLLEVGLLVGLALAFAGMGSYLILTVGRKLRTISERAARAAAPEIRAALEMGDEIGQLDSAIDQFTQQLRSSMTELHQKAAELNTAKKQLEEANRQLERVDKMKSDFLRFISHEFRSPLMCVRMSLNSLLEEPDQPLAADQEKYVEMALRSSERLLRLINQMIDLTKLRHARPCHHKKSVELRELVHRVLGNLREPFEQKKIKIYSNGNALTAPVRTDPESVEAALRHVFHNVVENCPEESQAEIRVNDEGDHVAVLVADNGPRIVERKFGDLFEGLVREYENNDPRWRNDVLGLTLAKEIIALQGGTLQIDSNPKGEGRLIIRLPKGEKP
jgi:signal transduction histidine kinase